MNTPAHSMQGSSDESNPFSSSPTAMLRRTCAGETWDSAGFAARAWQRGMGPIIEAPMPYEYKFPALLIFTKIAVRTRRRLARNYWLPWSYQNPVPFSTACTMYRQKTSRLSTPTPRYAAVPTSSLCPANAILGCSCLRKVLRWARTAGREYEIHKYLIQSIPDKTIRGVAITSPR